MIDLILWANTKANFRTFAIANGLLVGNPEDGYSLRDGFEYCWWAGNGEMVRQLWTTRISAPVAAVQAHVPRVPAVVEIDPETGEETVITPAVPEVPAEISFDTGGNPPTWLEGSVARRGVAVVGQYARLDGDAAVYRGEAVLGETLDLSTPDRQTVPGFVALCRIHGDFFDSDRLTPDEADPDALEQWARSKVARYIRNNGAPGTTQGIAYAELDGVRVFRYADVQAKLVEWGVPGHVWLGGNAG